MIQRVKNGTAFMCSHCWNHNVLKRVRGRAFFRWGAIANGVSVFLKQILRRSLLLIGARSIQYAAADVERLP